MTKLLKFGSYPVPFTNEVREGDKLNIRTLQTKRVFLTDIFIVTKIDSEKLEVSLKANYSDGPEVVIPKQDFTENYKFFKAI